MLRREWFMRTSLATGAFGLSALAPDAIEDHRREDNLNSTCGHPLGSVQIGQSCRFQNSASELSVVSLATIPGDGRLRRRCSRQGFE